MSKLPTEAADHAAQLERMRRLCSALDEAHEECERLCDDVTAEARRAIDAEPERSFTRRRTVGE